MLCMLIVLCMITHTITHYTKGLGPLIVSNCLSIQKGAPTRWAVYTTPHSIALLLLNLSFLASSLSTGLETEGSMID